MQSTHTDPYTNHSDIILLGKILNYHMDNEGVCSGISTMGMQAILAEDIETFEARRDFITDLIIKVLKAHPLKNIEKSAEVYLGVITNLEKEKRNDIISALLGQLNDTLYDELDQLSPEEEKKWWEVEPFFDGIVISQNSNQYADFLTEAPRGQHFRVALPLIAPVALDQSGIHEFEKVCYSFDFQELEFYLQQMQKIFSVTPSSKAINIVGSIASGRGGHSIVIGYDPKIEQWIFLNSDKKLVRTNEASVIAKHIFEVYQHKGHVNLALDTYGLKTDKEILEQPFKEIKNAFIENLKSNPTTLNIFDSRNEGLLSIATKAKYVDWVKIILDIMKENPHLKCDVDQCDIKKNTPLSFALMVQDLEIMWLLLQSKADANHVDEKDNTLLSYAIFHKNLKMIELLLQYGADPNKEMSPREHPGMFPLAYVINMNDEDILKLLLNYGADPNLKIPALSDYTATHVAAQLFKGNPAILQILIKHGADIDLESALSMTPLELIATKNNRDLIKAYAEKHANILLRSFKNHIETTDWKLKGALGFTGGEEIVLNDGTVKVVPRNVKLQWDEIKLAESGQKNNRTALKALIKIGKEAPFNKYRAKMTRQYLSLFQNSDPEKIYQELDAIRLSSNASKFKK